MQKSSPLRSVLCCRSSGTCSYQLCTSGSWYLFLFFLAKLLQLCQIGWFIVISKIFSAVIACPFLTRCFTCVKCPAVFQETWLGKVLMFMLIQMASSTWSFLIYPSVRQLSCHCWAVNLLTLKIAAKLHNLQITIKMSFFFFKLHHYHQLCYVLYLFIEHCMRYLRGLSRSTRIHTSFSLFMSESGVCRITMALCGRFSPYSTVGSRTTYDPFSMWVMSPSLVFKHAANVLLQEEFRGWGGWQGREPAFRDGFDELFRWPLNHKVDAVF